MKIRDYYQRYQSVMAAQFMVAQIGIGVLVAGAAWLMWRYAQLQPEALLLASMLVLILVELVAAPLLIRSLSEPIGVLSQAIVHVSKEGGSVPPPNINQPKYEHSGLRSIVEAVYDLAASGTSRITSTDQTAPTTGSLATLSPQATATILDLLPCGVVAFHADHTLAFCNSLAPTRQGQSGKPELELLFERSDDLEGWLKECETNKVKDTKIWRRIANKLPETDGLRIFDVIAYYNKGNESGIEAILVTIDRTADYAPDQEDMDFIALAAHELRGPITVIRGYLDVLGDELSSALQPDQKELIERLNVSANRLSGYINNILNVSRYDRKHLNLHLHKEDLMDIMKSLVDDLEMRARTQNRLLGFTVPENLPAIAADRNSLSEVISNLVDNAIKYSNEGGQVIVSAGVKGDFVEVTVQDFGIGMPASVVGNLFNKFYRSHRSRQTVGGTGLGLYISKAIIESHGGTIWVRSTEGQGTTFGFSIPIYATVADKLKSSNNGNEGIMENANGWIRNHAMYRR